MAATSKTTQNTGIALQTLKATVVDEDLDLVTGEGYPNLVPVNLQLRLTQRHSYV
jgi:hypothetical protein